MKKKSKKGNLIWITGLSGSGKTLIARKLKQKLLKQKKNYLLINGDGLRSIFELKKYDRNSRINYAYSYSKLCKKIVDQDLNVIIATVAMFDEIRKWNKSNIKNYFEIFVKMPFKSVKDRNKKNLYKSKILNVVGKDIKPEYPKNPNMILKNDFTKDIDCLVNIILNKLNQYYQIYTLFSKFI